uniref:Uncharacterized protein n=1 Tax=Amphimedon queenslandica TaxID=400682 RepID=A0A1X7UQ15_AMPQE
MGLHITGLSKIGQQFFCWFPDVFIYYVPTEFDSTKPFSSSHTLFPLI